MSKTIWMMDSDFCSECGCILLYFEVDLCDDCREQLAQDNENYVYDMADEYDELAHLPDSFDGETIPVTRWTL